LKSKNIRAAIFLVAAISGFAGNAFACGPFFPNNLLDAGDSAVLQPPVADFQLELERMKLVTAKTRAVPLADGQKYFEQSTEFEMSDLAAALKREKISSEQATVIMQAHLAERMKLNAFLKAQDEWSHFHSGIYDTNWVEQPNTNPPPVFPAIAVTPGLPREFADYFEGAIAWQNHKTWDANRAWERLLELPPSERHFKSVWAAFMLGNYYAEDVTNNPYYEIKLSDEDEALKYFGQVRTLATNGYTDSLGLATASLGEEARVYLRRKNYERAIELYLEQFAAGDDSAVNSLRFAAARAIAETNSTPAQLKNLANNSRARRVITAYLISRRPYDDANEAANSPDANNYFDRTTAWLNAVESADVKDVESASQLALAAYRANQMEIAQRWINRAGRELVAQWLQAKLFMRAGKTAEAARLLASLSREFPQQPPGTNAPVSFAQSLYVTVNSAWGDTIPIGSQAFGELGVLHLARREYTEALDALLRSGYWMDAAYVAERVLTTDELKGYIDRTWSVAINSGSNSNENTLSPLTGFTRPMTSREQIRYLLARRLARETGGPIALSYFPTNYSSDYQTLLTELRAGHDATLPAEIRAKNLFAAAVMTRTNGLELFGTELEPDWAIYGGNYDFGITWQNRATNEFQAKINLAGADEIERASSRQVDPDKRFHYRWQAAALAWEAAQLMPDNSDDTARVLCTAGTWLKDRDPQAADKFYKALVRRCRKTVLGEEADEIRWFPAQDIAGNKPRLETIKITPELTNAVAIPDGFSLEYPVPGRQYCVHEAEDVFIIARAVQRLGYPMTVEQLLQANPGLKRGPISEGRLIVIPKVPGESQEAGATNSADSISEPPMFSGTNYLVRAGDSIAKIAKQTGVSVKAIIDANRNLVPMKIKVGQMLVIPQPMGTNSPSMPDAAGAGN
jgi:LysM repeat protein